MTLKTSSTDFMNGLVFGFDVGTGSIGYAVRKGSQFKDVGVLICDSEGSDLSNRRDLRRQRRTLRSRNARRKWFAAELAKLGLPKPETPPHDPISLRLRALNGEALKPAELHAALVHLFKRRGYSKVPWANVEKAAKANATPKKDDDDEGVKVKVEAIRAKLDGKHPCQFLAEEKARVGKSPTDKWARKIYWPREVLRDEFLAIVKAQEKQFPKLAAGANRLLFGDTREVKGYPVFFNASGAHNPGVLGMRWPRFDNRGPALDSFRPVDEQGRPLHVVRKNKEAFTNAQWELALMNFRVLDANTRQKLDPRIQFPIFIENLRNAWNKTAKGISLERLKKLAAPFADKFFLVEHQKALSPDTNSGRARYSSPTLELIRKEIAAGRRVDPPQPILRRKGESADDALNRYLADVKHPLVRHRLVLFRRMLMQMVKRFGPPDMIVLEAVRSLALSQKNKNELNKRNEEFRKQRLNAREDLVANKESTSRNAIQRYRLWMEAKGRCPFCLETIARTELGHGADIEHLVPRSIVDCNEFYNLTVAHINCNRELKGDRTPFNAFGGTSQWPDLKDNAEKTFTGRKLEIFLSPKAEELIEQKADLQHTAYIARVIRHVALTQLGWLGEDGRDPTPEKLNPALNFQVTNGQLTSRLRKAWGLNQILHPLPNGTRWDELSEAEQKQFTEKNRGDLRHHALDAMVIACTLPWLAHRTHGAKDQFGRHGWWTQDEKQRSKAANPLFPNDGQMHEVVKKEIEKVVVRHHVSRSKHQRAYDTTIYGRPKQNGIPIPDCYVSREPITALKPTDLKSPKTGKSKVFPPLLGEYLATAWASYCEMKTDWEKQIKDNKGCLPEAFQAQLCFSDFQRWREDKAPSFRWPEKVVIPIKRVGYIGVENDNAVAPRGAHGYVARGGSVFREVRLHPSEDGKSLVPVFVPSWHLDKPIPKAPIKLDSEPVATIRRGETVEIKNSPSRNTPVGKYRVASTMQKNIQLLPVHLADSKEALKASGFLENGVNISWDTFIKSAGYELPHPPSAQSQSPGSVQA